MNEQVNQTYDKLTKAFDYNALLQRLQTCEKVNYFLLNIDNFSNINDAYGYETGDEALLQVASFINMVKPKTSTLYRFNSDKFVLIDESSFSKEDIEHIANSILSFFLIVI
ncbi:diguanylate cyclase domain-containing protein [Sulfurimonas sp.]|uniref:diguanylate cyclase domain-containing protein n=1 Tax=Sulfurimonas sp. TaxID=2022749 RepID=UPI002AB15A18|nr:diguanylate cyclase [Sulfurimonas sp.]